MKWVGLVLGLVLVLGSALPSRSAWAWRSMRPNIVVISPRPFIVITPGPFCCCLSPFQSQPFVFHHGVIPHRLFIVPPIVVPPPVISPFVRAPDLREAVPIPETGDPLSLGQEGEVEDDNEGEHDVSMDGGHPGAAARAASKGEAPSSGKNASVSGPGPTGGLFMRGQPSDFTGRRGSVLGSHGFGMIRFDSQSFLIVDVTPVDAQVFLDGRRLGSSRQLVARALPLSAGPHSLTVTAPGFRPYVAQFDADPSFPVRVRVALTPE